MAIRQLGPALAGTIFGAMHYILMAGEVADGAGVKKLPAPFAAVLTFSLICSVLIMVGFMIPRILRLNIALSTALLKGCDLCGRSIDRAIDKLRRGLIATMEGIASWLRTLPPPTDQTGSGH